MTNITSFLRDCLRAERASAGIANLFAHKIQSLRFITGEESATSHQFASLDLPPSIQEHLIKSTLLRGCTSHSFQGDERDHIILSLALDDHSPEGARRFAEREDVFNVAITRARNRMDVLHSFTPENLPASSLLRRYLAQAPLPSTQKKRIETTLADLAPALSAIGWKPLPQNSISGVPIDLLIQREGKIIAIDLIGTAGEEGQAISLSKSLILQRSGIPLYALRLDEWLLSKNKVIEFFHNQNL